MAAPGAPENLKTCKKCGVSSSQSFFYKDDSRCKPCANARTRERNLRSLYGLTPEDHNRMYIDQKGYCLICNKHQSEFKKSFSVDHDHTTGEVRGLLCGPCNSAIGLLQDSSIVVEAALSYLKRHGS